MADYLKLRATKIQQIMRNEGFARATVSCEEDGDNELVRLHWLDTKGDEQEVVTEGSFEDTPAEIAGFLTQMLEAA